MSNDFWKGYEPEPTRPAPVQEPFGYFKAEPFGWTDCAETDEGAIALYEHPAAQRQWIGLKDEEIVAAIYKAEGFNYGLDNGNVSDKAVIEYVRIVEAKLKEKNT
jgi:hypothetical protein